MDFIKQLKKTATYDSKISQSLEVSKVIDRRLIPRDLIQLN